MGIADKRPKLWALCFWSSWLLLKLHSTHDDTVLVTWSVQLRFLLDPHTTELVRGDSFQHFSICTYLGQLIFWFMHPWNLLSVFHHLLSLFCIKQYFGIARPVFKNAHGAIQFSNGGVLSRAEGAQCFMKVVSSAYWNGHWLAPISSPVVPQIAPA